MSSRVRRGRSAFLLAVATALGAVVGCAPQPTVTPTPTAPATVRTVEFEDRPFLLDVPAAPLPDKTVALIVLLHGYTASASGVMDYFGLRSLATERGFLVAAPQGSTDDNGDAFWNASKACCNVDGVDVDDSGYLSRLIGTILATYPVDPGRGYVVGHSNGAFMAHRLACDHADQIAAIASLAGALDVDADCDPSRPVSVLQIHGDADESIAYQGGDIGGNAFTSVEQTLALWRTSNSCPTGAQLGSGLDADREVAGEDVTPTEWTPCRDGSSVARWTITGGGHVPSLTDAFRMRLVDWLEAHRRQ